MNELMVNRTPDLIAAEIKNIKDQTRKVVLYNSIEIGRKLTEAKEMIGHGEWGNWLENKVEYSKSTANNLMVIFKEYGADQITLLEDNAKSQAFGNLGYSQAIALLGVPAEEREEFVKVNNVEDMSTRELKKTIEELKRTKEEKESAISEKDEAIKRLKDIEKSNKILEETFNTGAEEREKLDNEISSLEEKIKEMNERPIEVVVSDREIDEEVQAKINKLKMEKEEAERKLKYLEDKENDSVIKFKIYFDQIVKDYQKLLEELEIMKTVDEVEHVKYSKATKKFLNAMLGRL
ncbi:DUF3102 domain-containing protein [Clostridium gasigenes]|uniref:DUF3102 domain-containing protein n=1 Tax=Clostridium gasigenes TaxID=94869 RepID=UPI0016279266|nr:DUF3102 domain-containing protein [Clostridium gasigenes]MBB6622252.1 DUF3102 domain-containing protein [Clostridium gasigenes]